MAATEWYCSSLGVSPQTAPELGIPHGGSNPSRPHKAVIQMGEVDIQAHLFPKGSAPMHNTAQAVIKNTYIQLFKGREGGDSANHTAKNTGSMV